MTFDPNTSAPTGRRLGYATNPLDRLSARRDDAESMRRLHESPGSVTMVLAGDLVVLDAAGSPWLPLAMADRLGPPRQTALLGTTDGRAHFGRHVGAELPSDAMETYGLTIRDLRGLAVEGLLRPEALGALAQAKALFHWHRTHGFCANCGTPTAVESAGWRRHCPGCELMHFPRTDPVVIMMAVSGDRCLLGRQPRFPPHMYSCLAGFVEPGETIEDAVRRELAEETGIAAGLVTYRASQPWPFPASLMIGCMAEAASTTLTIDHEELEDARWFPRAEVQAMLEGRHPDGIVCPVPMAIAHHLMRDWAFA